MSFSRFLGRRRLLRRLFGLIIAIGIAGFVYMTLISHLSTVKSRKIIFHFNRTTPLNASHRIEGKINIDIWRKTCSLNINSLRQFPLFPLFPSERRYISVTDSIKYDLKDRWTAVRIMGYLHPPKTGHYAFHLSSPILAQLWLSTTSEPKNATKIAYTSYNVIKKLEFHVGNVKPVSEGVYLTKGNKYYFEILQAINDPLQLAGSLVLYWMLPKTVYFVKINGSQVSQYFNVSSVYKTPETSATDEVLPSLRLSDDEDRDAEKLYPLDKERTSESKQPVFTLKQAYIKQILGAHLDINGAEYNRETARILPYINRTGNDVIGAFPQCTYDPDYTKGRSLKRYDGVWNTFFPAVFPNDGSNLARLQLPPAHGSADHAKGNDILKEKEVIEVVKDFMGELNKKLPRKYVLNSITNVEKYNPKQIKGEKYLLELVLRRLNDRKLIRFSEFFFRKVDQQNLCFLQNMRWDAKVWVNVILNVKNQAGWVLAFVKEMARILKETRDEYVHFVIADYGNQGVDVAKEMKRHGIKSFTVFKRTGAFYKTSTINMAASKVDNANSIVLLMDLHLRYPSNLFETVRKHTIQGRTGFSPMLMRLFECGRPRTKHVYSHGFYEPNGFGIFAIYKSDWDSFGGMNEREFKNKWGGEDWEMVDRVLMKGYEIEKLRIPGFYHFFHDKAGMWSD